MNTTTTATATHSNITIGTGKSVHIAYTVNGRLCGSLCDRSVYCSGKRMRSIDADATCSRCAKVAASPTGQRSN